MFLATTIAVGLVAFFVGRGFRSPAQIAASAKPPSQSLITAPVRLVRPRTGVVLRGTLAFRGSTAIRAPASLGPSLPIVTASGTRPGGTVTGGMVVAAVADRPVIALAGAVPAYDNMAYGSAGVEVDELQRDLQGLGLATGSDPAGRYGLGTASAVAQLYDHLGYAAALEPAKVTTDATASKPMHVEQLATVPLGEVAFIRSLPATVVHTAPVGANVGANGIVTQLASGTLAIHATTDQNTASLVHIGEVGRATSDQTPGSFPIRLIAVHGTALSGNDGAPGATLVFAPTSVSRATPFIGQNLAVHMQIGGSSKPRLVVPVSAVFTRADGSSTVIIVRNGRQTSVPVSPGISYSGKEVVTPRAGYLRPGMQVVIGIS